MVLYLAKRLQCSTVCDIRRFRGLDGDLDSMRISEAVSLLFVVFEHRRSEEVEHSVCCISYCEARL